MLSPTILTASALLFAATGLAVYLALDLRRFLAGMPVLTSVSGVVAFREAVGRQMYGALAILLLGIASGIVAAVGFALRMTEWWELTVFFGALAAFFGVGVWCRAVERRAKAIPVIDDEIGRQRDEVVRVWMTRPLPTWRGGLSA